MNVPIIKNMDYIFRITIFVFASYFYWEMNRIQNIEKQLIGKKVTLSF